ncbi:MAG TPA: 50S ribosomal protein L25/general stress protein Ctc [Fermentimonas caenicola]|jgi:large subunit ribosomal protein L25|uniref:50S ribosomal protein L25/general stress protein Ctc n=1 Tax=Lascolabacillus sp. TaxID=1924068 RepID=UPI000AC4C2BA|nr:50S ribosomal protein L25/general stress protein Ctc [Lascolabacillus sp.]MBP6175900.1 50S ribosomal protein L25/general stress protein Ctc [Fermentimonas sp.]MDI9626069.1 50S ribosomal protein L25/general stress protein Ctc [Bacteroidota bacterium]TAH62580.1 MAG: 50S ribosomal protein L25/general stress protein Ctc [Fermentimonas caenicola]MBP6196432.1 50S ribosomal protein L25/general stress protein Ctc [Fermentimonas sp.]MBP7104459.1 50S ribosomal protein L25/general stress protein Ctc [
MKTFELKGEIRDGFGKKAAKSYRSEGLIPCVVYGGHGNENLNFVIKQGAVRNLIYTPEVFLVNLDLGEKKMQAILKEVQFHPVKEQILHIDFLHVFEDKPVVIELPVRLKGLAAGVKAGGKLSLDLRKLRVRALAANLPEELVINVEKLALGKSIQVGDLSFEGLELLNAKNAVVCRVQLTRAARGDAAAAAAAGVEGEESEESESSEE